MPLNLDTLGARSFVDALLSPSISPRVTVAVRSDGVTVAESLVVLVSRSGALLRVRGHAPAQSSAFSVDAFALELGALSIRAGIAPVDVAFIDAAPNPGVYFELTFALADSYAPPAVVTTTGTVESRLAALEAAFAGLAGSGALAAEATVRANADQAETQERQTADQAEAAARQAADTALGARMDDEAAEREDADAQNAAAVIAERARAEAAEAATLTASAPVVVDGTIAFSLPGLDAGGANTAIVVLSLLTSPPPGTLAEGAFVELVVPSASLPDGTWLPLSRGLIGPAESMPAFRAQSVSIAPETFGGLPVKVVIHRVRQL